MAPWYYNLYRSLYMYRYNLTSSDPRLSESFSIWERCHHDYTCTMRCVSWNALWPLSGYVRGNCSYCNGGQSINQKEHGYACHLGCSSNIIKLSKWFPLSFLHSRVFHFAKKTWIIVSTKITMEPSINSAVLFFIAREVVLLKKIRKVITSNVLCRFIIQVSL